MNKTTAATIAKQIAGCQQQGLLRYYSIGKTLAAALDSQKSTYRQKIMPNVVKALETRHIGIGTSTLYGALRLADLPMDIVEDLDRALCPWRALLLLLRGDDEDRDKLLADIEDKGAKAFVEDYRAQLASRRHKQTWYLVINTKTGRIESQHLMRDTEANRLAAARGPGYGVLHCMWAGAAGDRDRKPMPGRKSIPTARRRGQPISTIVDA